DNETKKNKSLSIINDNKITIQKSNYLSSIIINDPVKTKILIDTGAEDINLISEECYLQYKNKELTSEVQSTNQLIIPLGNKPLETMGITIIKIKFNKEFSIPFTIVKKIAQYDAIF